MIQLTQINNSTYPCIVFITSDLTKHPAGCRCEDVTSVVVIEIIKKQRKDGN